MVVASLSQGRTAAAQCGLFTHKSVPVIFEPPCTGIYSMEQSKLQLKLPEVVNPATEWYADGIEPVKIHVVTPPD